MPGTEGNGRWRPTKSAKFGVVVFSYEPQKASYPFLRLQFGDVMQILEENGGWYRGFALRDKHSKGIFPASHIHLKECSVKNHGPDETVVPKEDPIVQEISDVLREWSHVWKRLYAEGKRRQFQELTQLMRDLLDKRRQIVSKTLPRDELKELKQLVGQKIDHGNRMMGLDLVPRDDSGAPINPKTAGVMHLYKAMKAISQQANEPGNRKSYITLTPQSAPVPKRDEHHLFLKFSALALPVNEPCELFFFIYDARQSKVLSERYMISLTQHCLPKDQEKINQCFAVFTDFDPSDLQNKDLYLACQVIRVGNDLESKRTANPLRKPHGAAVYPIHRVLNIKGSDSEEKDIQMEVNICPPAEYHKLLDSIIKKQGAFHPTEKGTGVFISLKPLQGPLDRVKEGNPLLFRKYTAECQKLGFPEIIRPYDVRHDVYLTLLHGLFNKGTKRADKNVEIDVQIIDDKEHVLENCITPGIGEPNVTLYHSTVQYHCSNPFFQETIKLAIPASMMGMCRVRFAIYHKSTIISGRLGRSEPFAIAHLKLMNEDDTALQDGVHELFVYKYKETLRGAFRYLTLPCVNNPNVPQIIPPDLISPRDNFFVRTQICSTKLTQNVDLHGLLHWRQCKLERLPSILTAVIKVPGDEIVKFLADTFNALFAIMEERGDEFGDLVFEALVFIIGLLAVEKYENFRPVLDTYCDKLFNAATVHTHLVAKMKHVFEQVMLVNGSRKMRGDIIQKTLKAAEFLIKFIMKSRVLYEQGTRGKNSEQFLQSLKDLLRTTCAMMRLECPENELIAPRAQAQALQFFPSTFDLFLTVMSVKSLGEIVAEFLNNLKETKLKIYKSVFIDAVVSSELFKHRDSRVVILPAILRHLKHHISNRDELLDKSLGVLGSILVLLHDQDPVTVDEEVCVMVRNVLQVLLDCFMNLTGRSEKVTQVVGHCVAALMALLELMSPRHYQMIRQTFAKASDLEEFILCTFNAFCELVALNLYSSDWTNVKLLLNYVILRATTQLSQILVEDFLGVDHDPLFFNPTLWENFFQLAVAFTCQPTLQLEVMGEVKRNRALDSYGDMRIAMNTLMIAKWRALGHYQSRYVPSMIGPFLRVSLIPHTTIRRTTIPIFYDMMENEYKYKKNFHMMETEMIDKLDVFISGGNGDASYRQLLHHMLTDRCKSSTQMDRESGVAFIESLTELLRRLLDYRTVHTGDEYRDLHMHVMFNLLNFYKEMGREEIYIRYIYHLAELHKASGNWVEAGFTLLLHAQLLQWTTHIQKQEGPYPRQSSAERKEQLYHDIIEFFHKGKLWECGIDQCKEIASQLETVTFDYEKLSDIHQTISKFFSNIIREIRAEPEYFRVGLYGGFPPFLKNKIFIFRGQEYEKLSAFNARLSSQFPNAKNMKSLEPPGLDILESSEQYIQSCSVEPLPEREVVSKFEGKTIAEQIVRFYHTNHVRRFMLKRPFHRGQKNKENEYKTLHTECITYTTAYRFPGILRWFEVIKAEVTELTPVENGIEMVLDNLNQLRTVISRIRGNPTQSTSPLTMKLNGTLDAAVNGGVSKFEVFFTTEYQEQNPKCVHFVPRLKMLMEELCKILEEGVSLHASVRPESMKGLHMRMEELLADYSARYGSRGSSVGASAEYDSVNFLPLEGEPKRRLSSNRRKVAQKAAMDRSNTVLGGRPSSFHERQLESLAESPSLEQRGRAATEFVKQPYDSQDSTGSRDYDEPPRIPLKRAQTSLAFSPAHRASQTPPPVPPSRRTPGHVTPQSDGSPPPPPLRRFISQPTTKEKEKDELDAPPPTIPPRSSSVRLRGSRESLNSNSPSTTPMEGTPVTSHRDLSAPQSAFNNVRDFVARMQMEADEEELPPPPPLPRRINKPALQLKDGAPTTESTS